MNQPVDGSRLRQLAEYWKFRFGQVAKAIESIAPKSIDSSELNLL
jgi:hypothetical protein